jgi:hypothetical protein
MLLKHPEPGIRTTFAAQMIGPRPTLRAVRPLAAYCAEDSRPECPRCAERASGWSRQRAHVVARLPSSARW